MGVQSILEEVDFDNEQLAALKSSKEGAAKSRWVMAVADFDTCSNEYSNTIDLGDQHLRPNA